MKLSQLRDLTAPLAINYRGLIINIEAYTERFYDQGLKAELEARTGAEPVREVLPPLPEDASLEQVTQQADAQHSLDDAHAQAVRERRKKLDAEFLAAIVKRWDILGDDEQELPVTADTVLQLGSVLHASILKSIVDEVSRPLKPIS